MPIQRRRTRAGRHNKLVWRRKHYGNVGTLILVAVLLVCLIHIGEPRGSMSSLDDSTIKRGRNDVDQRMFVVKYQRLYALPGDVLAAYIVNALSVWAVPSTLFVAYLGTIVLKKRAA